MRSALPGLWRRILGWLFGAVRFPEEGEAQIRTLAEKGTLVFVSRSAGLLPYLYFNWTFLQRGLPLPRYVNGIRPSLARLFGPGPAPTPPAPGSLAEYAAHTRDEGLLAATVEAGEPALVFLWQRARALTGRKAGFESDHAAALIAVQRRLDRPIYLVPTLLLVGPRPTRSARPSLLDLLFGPREAPGRLRSLLTFLRWRKNAHVKLGRPINLKSFVEARAEVEDHRLGRMVRGALAQYLAREERVVTGPPVKSTQRIVHEILRDARTRAALAGIAESTGRPLSEVLHEARRDLEEIAARPSPTVIGLLERLFRWIFHRIYDGIHIDPADLRRVAQAAKKGPLVLVPSHRSHMDYLVLSWVFVRNGLTPPLIAAGKNMAFFPAGPILRRGGAYFLRRSFKDDPVYTTVFRAYVRKLMREGFPQEFFIEGTRSRTGKQLPPRLGMVTYHLEAFLDSHHEDLFFVPVYIGYTRVIETGAYRRELQGGEKERENVRGLLKASRVLRSRYGRIDVEIGEILSLRRFLESRGFTRPFSLDAEEKRRTVRALAYRIAYEIDRVTTITPSALAAAALVCVRRRGMTLVELTEHAEFFYDFLAGRPLRFSAALRRDAAGRIDPRCLADAVESFAEQGLVRLHGIGETRVVEVLPEGRLGLDYYKNALVPFFAERSLAAHGLMSFEAVREGRKVPVAEVTARVAALARLLSREFIYRPGVDFETVVDEVAAELEARGWIEITGKRPPKVRLTPEGAEPLERLRALTLNLVEGYWLAADVCSRLLTPERTLEEAEVLAAIMETGRVLVLTGRIEAAEAATKPILQAALSAFAGSGLLEREGRRGERLRGPDPEGLAALAASLEPLVGRRTTPA